MLSFFLYSITTIYIQVTDFLQLVLFTSICLLSIIAVSGFLEGGFGRKAVALCRRTPIIVGKHCLTSHSGNKQFFSIFIDLEVVCRFNVVY